MALIIPFEYEWFLNKSIKLIDWTQTDTTFRVQVDLGVMTITNYATLPVL